MLKLGPRSFLQADTPRVWTRKRGDPNVVIYCAGSIWTGRVHRSRLEEVINTFHLGASPAMAIGDTAREIALVSVERAEADLRHRTFAFEHSTHLGTARTSFSMGNDDDMNELTGILRSQLGAGFTSGPIAFDAAKLFGLPLAIFFVLLTVGGALWYVSRPASRILPRGSALERVFTDLGDQRLMMIAGGVAAALALWALLRAALRPKGMQFNRETFV